MIRSHHHSKGAGLLLPSIDVLPVDFCYGDDSEMAEEYFQEQSNKAMKKIESEMGVGPNNHKLLKVPNMTDSNKNSGKIGSVYDVSQLRNALDDIKQAMASSPAESRVADYLGENMGLDKFNISKFVKEMEEGWSCVKYSRKGKAQMRRLFLSLDHQQVLWKKSQGIKRFWMKDLKHVDFQPCSTRRHQVHGVTGLTPQECATTFALVFGHRKLYITCKCIEERATMSLGFYALHLLQQSPTELDYPR